MNEEKLETYLFSFWGVHQNFKAIAGLNYRFIGYLYVRVFSTYKTGIMTTSNDFTIQVLAGVVKKVCLAFSLVDISFLRILCIRPMLKFTFQPNFIFFWILLDLLVSVHIHVIKIITWNVVDVWHISFSSDPPNILLWVWIGIALKV